MDGLRLPHAFEDGVHRDEDRPASGIDFAHGRVDPGDGPRVRDVCKSITGHVEGNDDVLNVGRRLGALPRHDASPLDAGRLDALRRDRIALAFDVRSRVRAETNLKVRRLDDVGEVLANGSDPREFVVAPPPTRFGARVQPRPNCDAAQRERPGARVSNPAAMRVVFLTSLIQRSEERVDRRMRRMRQTMRAT